MLFQLTSTATWNYVLVSHHPVIFSSAVDLSRTTEKSTKTKSITITFYSECYFAKYIYVGEMKDKNCYHYQDQSNQK